MLRSGLLACGVLSSLLYAGTLVVGEMSWDNYDLASQAISELTTLDAPTRPLLLPFFTIYSLLVVAFGFGIMQSAGSNRPLRLCGVLWVTIGIVDLTAPFFPMHLRGAERTSTDDMHIVLTMVTVLLSTLAIGFGAVALRKKFRLYSIATILVILAFGIWAGLDAPRLEAELPTPHLGLRERISIAAFLLWVAVLAVMLLRAKADRAPAVPPPISAI